jgi:hypothetical protein
MWTLFQHENVADRQRKTGQYIAAYKPKARPGHERALLIRCGNKQ